MKIAILRRRKSSSIRAVAPSMNEKLVVDKGHIRARFCNERPHNGESIATLDIHGLH